MKASLALLSLLTAFTSHSLKSPAVPPTVVQIQANTNLAIADGARQQIGSTLFYDPAYVQLTYPGGDVPQERGVCSDVVIRALRSQKVDLQKLVHEDMAKNFAEYPQKWKLKRPDSNIDHRRVPNLETWFSRHDKTRPTSKNPSDYQAGDIVSWRLDNGLAHIVLKNIFIDFSNIKNDFIIYPYIEFSTFVTLFLFFMVLFLSSVLIPVWKISAINPYESLR